MRKSVLALVGATSVFALTAAGAAGYNFTLSTDAIEYSATETQSVVTNGCPDITTVTTSYSVVANHITAVNVATDDNTCTIGFTVTLANDDDSTEVLYTGSSMTAGSGSATPVGGGWDLTTGSGDGLIAHLTVTINP